MQTMTAENYCPFKVPIRLQTDRETSGFIFTEMGKRIPEPTNGFHIHGWMVSELGLQGPELIAYALVHQFTQCGAGIYTGGVPYLAGWLGCHLDTARKYLHQLSEKGLIKEDRGFLNGVPYCNYYAIGIPETIGIPENFGDPEKAGEDTRKIQGGIPENFGVKHKDITIKENRNNISKSRKVFVKPTIEEVAAYCRERGNTIDPEAFIDHYESSGWIVGRSPMKDWKAAVRTWEKRRDIRPASSKPEKESLSDYYRKLYKQLGINPDGTAIGTPAQQTPPQYGRQPYDFAADFGIDEQ